jgi:hypothetical protein
VDEQAAQVGGQIGVKPLFALQLLGCVKSADIGNHPQLLGRVGLVEAVRMVRSAR